MYIFGSPLPLFPEGLPGGQPGPVPPQILYLDVFYTDPPIVGVQIYGNPCYQEQPAAEDQ